MLVKNIPPVPEGFDPDSVTYGVPPSTEICRLVVGGEIPKWHKPIKAKWDCNHIFCLPIKPWYPASWYNSKGDLLPDVYEYDHDSNQWPTTVRPKDIIEALWRFERNKEGYYTAESTASDTQWDDIVAYRVVKRYSGTHPHQV